MIKAFTLRPDYEGVLVGGSVVAGPNGEALNVLEALEEGGGKIVTDNILLQSSLENYYGHAGLVFNMATVDPDTGEEKPVEKEEQPQVINEPPPAASDAGIQAAAVPAEHGDASDYSSFSADELRSTLKERNVEVPGRATRDQMIGMLQEDDETRTAEQLQEGATGNGS